MTLYLIYMILATIALASIVPLMQYIVCLKKNKSSAEGLYYFSQELVDRETESFSVKNGIQPAVVNRVELTNRGWVRCPNGSVMSEQEFEDKKRAEYLIDLP